MKKFISLILTMVISMSLVYSVHGQSTDWATSVTPTLQSGIGFDFTQFSSGSHLPVKMNAVVSGGEILFDSGLIAEACGSGDVSEAYVQAGSFYADSPFTAEFEISASKETAGNVSVYLRDGLAQHAGCEIPLVLFESDYVSCGGKRIGEYVGDELHFRIDVNPRNGKVSFYLDGKFLHTTQKEYSEFDFSKFYLRFHSSTKSHASGTNRLKIKRLFAVSDISHRESLSVMNKGVYSEGFVTNTPINGINTLLFNISNSSDDEQNLYFACAVNCGETQYIPFCAEPKSFGDYEFKTEISDFNKNDKFTAFIADSNKNPITSRIIYTSNGYAPPNPLQIKEDSEISSGVHPRIAANSSDFEKAISLYNSDTTVGNAYMAGYDKTLADKLISKSPDGGYYHVPCSYDDNDDLRLLAADTVLRYCKALSAQYILTGNGEYKTRLWAELQNAASYPDWNPKHFLDTAALCYAFALSYDWLYDSWSDSEKEFIADALASKGLSCYISAYRGTIDSHAEWRYRRNNWNAVCNGGGIIGALALIDIPQYSDMCAEITYGAMKYLSTALESFSPDGAWYEGTGYWAYTMQYLTLAMATLKNTAGTFYGIDMVDGISKTSLFPLYTTGEYEINLNDNGVGGYVSIPENMYMAKIFSTPSSAAYRLKQICENDNEAEILDLLWYEPEYENAGIEDDIHGMTILGGTDLAVMRSKKSFAAIHWGYNNISHGHLDCGTLFYDSNGERWLEDLGADDYNLHDYFNVADSAYPKGRWAYYRNRAEAHNTIVIGSDNSQPDQLPASGGKLSKAIEWDSGSFAVVDMSDCYSRAEKVRRGAWFDSDSGRMTIVDEVTMRADFADDEICHIFHTKADAIVADKGKTLYLIKESDGKLKYITMKILSGGDEVFEVEEEKPFVTSPNPDEWKENISLSKKQATNTGSKIVVRQSAKSGLNSLQIALIPQGDGMNPFNAPKLMKALEQW